MATTAVVVATVAQALLDPYVGTAFPWVSYCFGVFAAAWFGGLQPAVITLALGYLAATFLFVTPGTLGVRVESLAAVTVYLTYGLFAGLVTESLHRSRRAAQRAARQASEERERLRIAQRELQTLNASLEKRVKQRTARLERQTRQLRYLANELTEAEQRERRKLAQKLHDGLQQMLVAIKMQLPLCRGSAADCHLARVEEILDNTIGASRSLAYELSPPILYDSGLPEALEWLARWFADREALSVELKMAPRLPTLAENAKVFLFHAVRELLQNALRHGGVQSAQVELTNSGNSLKAVVRDKGHGFDPGQLAEETERPHGFGLFNIRERLDALGGKLKIDSCPGAGAELTLVLPVAATEPTASERPRIRTTKQGINDVSANSGDHIRILLADDHKIVREGLTAMLRGQKEFQVVGEASDGLEAIERADALRPDVVVMDVNMPHVGGVEATRRIKEQHPEICVIGLSLHEAEDMARAMGEAGASAYLRKDGPSDRLFSTIRSLCGTEGA